MKTRIIHVNGTEEEIAPDGGATFSLARLQAIVGGYVQTIPLGFKPDGTPMVMICNEEGRLKGLPLNQKASEAYWQIYGPVDHVVGDVLVCREDQLS